MAKKQPNHKRGVGQPEFVPDYGLLKNIAGLFPSDEEIAVVLGCSRQTIAKLKKSDERYISVINTAHQGTKMKLRQLQMQHALDGNVTMLMFLGKQKLGQADTQKHIGDPDRPLQTATTIDLTPAQLKEAIKALKSETSI